MFPAESPRPLPEPEERGVDRVWVVEKVSYAFNALDEIARYVHPGRPELWDWYVQTLAAEIKKLDEMCKHLAENPVQF